MSVSEDKTDRKTLLADASIRVLDEQGMRGLTHRATEQEAGLPAGTCSHHFPTRRALIEAVLGRIAELDREELGDFEPGQPRRELDEATLLDGTTATLANWLGPGRARTRARLMLRLDPPSRNLAEGVMDDLTREFRQRAMVITGDAERADLITALITGVTLEELDSGTVPVDLSRLRARLAPIVALAVAP
jgi:DNA-binding transcriptional regulator YbjK